MNILITGSNGFIGRNLFKLLKNNYNHNIYTISRNNINLLDSDSINNYFANQKIFFDLVIHTAIKGGRRNIDDDNSIVYNNILMLYNLLRNQNYFKYIISFGSGAELDRRYNIDSKTLDRYPIDPYGLSKSVIQKISISEPKLCNFRIYNCFGIDEEPNRMIRNNITKYLNHENIIIHKDRKMDFFFVDDLARLINFYLNSNNMPKLFDCCYEEKLTLSNIANIINNLDTHKVDIIQTNDLNSIETDYIGQYRKIDVNYIGLNNAIKIIYDYYKKEKAT